jgi:cytochrome c-type biogenesis protein CcmF
MPLLGQLALWLALLLGFWGALVGQAGGRLDRADLQESARRAAVALAGALVVALAALAVAVVRQDFHVAYVASHADRALAARDAWAVVFDGTAGRLLVGGTLLALGVAVARQLARREDRRALTFTLALGCGVAGVGVAALLLVASPFAFLSYTPVDGQGLSQRLYDLDARLDLVLRCAAYAAAVIPVTRWLGGQWARHDDVTWRRGTHRWATIAWTLVSAELGLS